MKAGVNDRALLLEMLRRLATYDPRKLYDAHGKLIAIKDLDDETRSAIIGFEYVQKFRGKGKSRVAVGYVKRIKLANRARAAALLKKMMGPTGKLSKRPANPLQQPTRAVLRQMQKEMIHCLTGGTT